MSKLTPEEMKIQQDILYGKKPNSMIVTMDDIDALGDKDAMMSAVVDIEKYRRMLKQRITLINDPLTAAIPFTCENLYLFCAYTGSGKSTVAANITYPLWKQGKKVLVLSNEESRQDVLFRIAALELGLNFNDYKKGEMDKEDVLRAISLFPAIGEQVKIMDISYRDGFTMRVEGVKSALEAVKDRNDYSCVLIDYYQLIKYSTLDSKKKTYENLNDFRIWLGQYIKSSAMPVVLFAQLYSVDKKGTKGVEARLKECSSVVEPATVIIEICPNFETNTSEFIIHKDRFGRSGHKLVCAFDKGRFNKLTLDELVEREKIAKLKSQEAKIEKLEAMVRNDDQG